MKLIIRKSMIFIFLLSILNPLFLLAEIEIQNAENSTVKDSDNIIFNKYQVVDDFIAVSVSSTLDICSCSQYTDTIKIYNSGTISNKYSINANKDYIVISDSIITLNPGEEKEVKVFITAPCTKDKDDIEYTISTMTEKTKVISKEINTDFCSTFALDGVKTEIVSGPCELQVFKIDIFNTGNFKDEYLFSIDNFQDNIRFSEESVTLLPFTNTSLFIYFEPECSMYGVNEMTFFADSKKTGIESNIGLRSDIRREYEYLVNAKSEIFQCNMRYSEREFSITNLAKINNSYDLDIEGPEWVSLSQDKVAIGPFETKNIKIILAPTLDIGEEKPVKINLTAKSTLGDIEKKQEISIDLNDCYSFEIEPQYDGSLLLCSDDKKVYFEIGNTGVLTNTYDLAASGKRRGFLSLFMKNNNIIDPLQPKDIVIMPEEKEKAYVNLNLSDKKAKYTVSLNAQTFSNEYNKTGKQKIDVITKQECYAVSTDLASRYVFNRSENTILLNITNKGAKGGLYELKILNADWASIEKEFIFLNKGQSESVKVVFEPDENVPDDTYKLQLQISSEDRFYISDSFNVKIRNQTSWQRFIIFMTSFNYDKDDKDGNETFWGDGSSFWKSDDKIEPIQNTSSETQSETINETQITQATEVETDEVQEQNSVPQGGETIPADETDTETRTQVIGTLYEICVVYKGNEQIDEYFKGSPIVQEYSEEDLDRLCEDVSVPETQPETVAGEEQMSENLSGTMISNAIETNMTEEEGKISKILSSSKTPYFIMGFLISLILILLVYILATYIKSNDEENDQDISDSSMIDIQRNNSQRSRKSNRSATKSKSRKKPAKR